RGNAEARAAERAQRQGVRQAGQQAGLGGVGGLPRYIVRGGVGEFRGRAPTTLFASAIDATGLSDAGAQLVCIGAAVPAADWAAYAADPSAIPTSCAGAGPVPDPTATRRRSVTLFDDDFGAPRTWRASLGVTRRLLERYALSLDLSAARGLKLYGVTDLNLDPTPEFFLAAEGGRPVFVPAGTIVPATGQTSLAASRRFAERTELGQVLAVDSRLRSGTGQATLSLNGFTTRGVNFSLGYTLQRVRDQSSFTCCSAAQGFASPTTAGDPNVREWATSDLERRHSLVGTVSWPLRAWLEVTSVARVSSGQRFTPIVGGDVNGDGARNDRAFVFDPAAVLAGAATPEDSAVAAGMSRLLDAAPADARACLAAQRGRIADRNSCRGPWTPSLDFQVNLRPGGAGLDRRLTLSLIAVNTLGGLDQLLHGAEGLRGWGQPARADPTLLYVRGFDPARQRFVYQVNERFGDTRGARTAVRAPFQVALQARLTVGPDQARDRIRQIFGGQGGQGAAGRAGGPAGPGAGGQAGGIARLLRLPNPIDSLLAYRDSLALTDAQVAQLTPIRDTLAAKVDALAEGAMKEMQKASQSLDPLSTFAQLRPRIQEGRTMVQQALDAAEKVLTPEQWAKVPERVKRPMRGLDRMMGAPGRP
ncbi:MAG: Spy/CpxP family protein refolding chaperone, partial [Gemmatimonadaceae bacterium]